MRVKALIAVPQERTRLEDGLVGHVRVLGLGPARVNAGGAFREEITSDCVREVVLALALRAAQPEQRRGHDAVLREQLRRGAVVLAMIIGRLLKRTVADDARGAIGHEDLAVARWYQGRHLLESPGALLLRPGEELRYLVSGRPGHTERGGQELNDSHGPPRSSDRDASSSLHEVSGIVGVRQRVERRANGLEQVLAAASRPAA